MNLPHIIQAVYTRPWAITREGWSAVHAIVKTRLDDLNAPLPKADDDEDTDFFGQPLPKMQVTDDGVAIIPICGVLMQHAGLIERMCGACSYDDIRRDLDTAQGVRALRKIVLHIDSPGGYINGCPETADKISRVRESGIRIEAVSDTQICSAAYWLAAGCHSIECTRSADIGSIGVLLALLDSSLAFEMEGLKRELFTSGPLKGIGISGTSLTDEQRLHLQDGVDQCFDMFRTHVLRYRGLDDDTMQGQSFIGPAALNAGLVDELVDDVAERLCVDSDSLLNDQF